MPLPLLFVLAAAADAADDVHFALLDRTSARGEAGAVCEACHTPHTAGVGGWIGGDDPPARSAACLTCHDGAIGTDMSFLVGPSHTGEHPNGIVYDRLRDPALRDPAEVAAAGLVLYEDADGGLVVECTTCHAPHRSTWAPLLRRSNAGSGLCLSCHLK